MGLKEYRRKRQFRETPEPAPAAGPARKRAGKAGPKMGPARAAAKKPSAAAGLQFVVQKHQATRLHYDLRLEHAGVLKSWAVPKGPSMDPNDRRLAVMVEDHPFEYKDFAGRIPEGQYGAGWVEIWDKGTYSLAGEFAAGDPEKSMAAGLKKGHIDFVLQGKRLRGLFTLVRIRGRDGKDNQWLLMKRKEPPAGARGGGGGAAKDGAGRRGGDKGGGESGEEDAGAGGGSGRHAAAAATPGGPAGPPSLDGLDLEGAVKRPLPDDLRPMLAELAEGPFDREGWSFEVKWDGYRSLAEIRKGRVRLVSRNGKNQNDRFPGVAAALDGYPLEAVFDGEIVAVDETGRPDFQALQNARRGAGRGRILYYVFDVLYAGGYDLTPLPLRRRRAVLERILPKSPIVRLSETIEKDGRAFFRAAEKNGLEGLVAKDLGSPYRPGQRTGNWLKIKIQNRQEAVIGGFTAPRSSRGYFGALVLGAYKNGKLAYIGRVGTGFSERTLKEIHEKLVPLRAEKSPFAEEPPRDVPVTWVEPRLICEVKFSQWTDEGIMRHPVFLGLREDKSPREVRPERPAPAAGAESPGARIPKLRTRAALTNLDKVFWPGQGYTKSDLIEYYWKVAEWILPYLKDRPQALNRHPDGVEGPSFFQKDVGRESLPPWVETVEIPSETRGKAVRTLVCQNRDTLLYLANLGCIELNVWSSSIRDLDSPDYAVFDFDPLDVPFQAVIEAVLAAKAFLDELRVPAFCKTSGATGMHVYIPLAPGFSHEQARELAHLVLLVVQRRHPDLTSLKRLPGSRKGRVYLDYLQNRRGATMASAYALRPVDGAPVSTPLAWKDVTAKLDPSEFNIRTVPERLARRGDVWKGFFETRVDPNAVLARFEKWRKSRASL